MEETNTPQKYRIGWLKDIIRIAVTALVIIPVAIALIKYAQFIWSIF